jgi:nitrate reductase NapE component
LNKEDEIKMFIVLVAFVQICILTVIIYMLLRYGFNIHIFQIPLKPGELPYA